MFSIFPIAQLTPVIYKMAFLPHGTNVKKKFTRNQKVYIEGDKSDRVFVVVKGEFELKKHLVKREEANYVKVTKMLGSS